jgi:NitT/TauT family transport system permease protein
MMKKPVSPHSLFYGLAGAVVLLVVWQLLSTVVNPAVLASPLDTARELWRLALEGDLFRQGLITARRLVLGLLIGGALGLALGVIAGLLPALRAFCEPLRWLSMTIPAVVVAVLAMLWLGIGERQVIFVVAVIVAPVIYVNTLAGVLAIDERLLEMGRVYGFSRRQMLTCVYLPGIGSPVFAGLTLAAGIGVRAAVLGEVLGAFDGVGHSFSRAMSFLKTPEVFAWVIAILGLMALLEFALLNPARRRVMRWKRPK